MKIDRSQIDLKICFYKVAIVFFTTVLLAYMSDECFTTFINL